MPFLSKLPGLKIFLVNADVFSALRKRAITRGAARTCGEAAAERPQAAPARPAAGRPRRPLGYSSLSQG